MGIGGDIYELMQTISYSFSDTSHLEIALTHSSYSNEMRKRGFRAESNEAYEFLGDAILQLMISEELFDRYSKEGEGMLTKYRQSLVCEDALASIARSISLGKYLNIGTSEENTDLRSRKKVLADAFEALVAAIYRDSKGFSEKNARLAVISLFENKISAVVKRGSTDYKSMLQQFVEKNAGSELIYKYTEAGPEHNKRFNVIAYVNNNEVGRGSGETKRSAESSAAEKALRLFGII